MPTTGGALAFDGFIPPYAATLTRNLEEAGAIIIAKAGLSELANFVAGAPTPMPGDYNVATQGGATIAPGGLEIYPANGPIPNWGNSALILSLKSGWVYRVKLSADGSSAAGEPTQHLKSTNRYRDIAISPNGRTIYLATDSQGSSTDESPLPSESISCAIRKRRPIAVCSSAARSRESRSMRCPKIQTSCASSS